MTDNSTPSITVTPSRLSFALALATLVGLLWSSTAYVTQLDSRLAAVETYVVEQKATNREILAEIKQLSITVTRLAVVIEGANAKLGTVK